VIAPRTIAKLGSVTLFDFHKIEVVSGDPCLVFVAEVWNLNSRLQFAMKRLESQAHSISEI
jgi:hypothetical protein